ncbi:hypothetical protein [Mycoplasma sp. ATU-Cv-508]|uniref:hypothetical protein n=1 Tax=Mycoplasma sp. ATU-Cv-508 TaxID=2048001 RepID=UPI000FDE1158
MSSPHHYQSQLSFNPGQSAWQIVARFGHQHQLTYQRIYERRKGAWVLIEPERVITYDCSLRVV